jgi:hypothetical protein
VVVTDQQAVVVLGVLLSMLHSVAVMAAAQIATKVVAAQVAILVRVALVDILAQLLVVVVAVVVQAPTVPLSVLVEVVWVSMVKVHQAVAYFTMSLVRAVRAVLVVLLARVTTSMASRLDREIMVVVVQAMQSRR